MSNDSMDQALLLCQTKLIDYLSRRDHSEKELRQKLIKKEFDPYTIDKAIQWALERQYLKQPIELSKSLALHLLEKGKGRYFIQQYLKKKGLPSVDFLDADTELHKALEIARQKAQKNASLDRKSLEKIGRHLVSRGFPLEIVRTVIYEKLRSDEEF